MARWDGDYGQFELPADVPMGAMRADGWFDGTRHIGPQARAYFQQMDEHIRDGKPILTWAAWQRRQ